jgi:hypothetical protein
MQKITEKILLLAKVGCVALTMATAIAIIACNDDGNKCLEFNKIIQIK